MEIIAFLLKELKGVVTSVAPLVVILLFLKFVVFRSPLENNKQFFAGIIFTIIGLLFFLQGAHMSLIPLAESTGAELIKLNRPLIIVVAFCIGFVATLVEPALSSITHEVENISVGVINSRFLMLLTAFGFAVGMAVGVVKIIFNIKFFYIIIPMLFLLAILAYFCDTTIAAIAFDCAAATTGPVNIPVNMAIALGLARTIKGVDPLSAGFGLVGVTIVFVAAAIMTMGCFKSM